MRRATEPTGPSGPNRPARHRGDRRDEPARERASHGVGDPDGRRPAGVGNLWARCGATRRPEEGMPAPRCPGIDPGWGWPEGLAEMTDRPTARRSRQSERARQPAASKRCLDCGRATRAQSGLTRPTDLTRRGHPDRPRSPRAHLLRPSGSEKDRQQGPGPVEQASPRIRRRVRDAQTCTTTTTSRREEGMPANHGAHRDCRADRTGRRDVTDGGPVTAE
jgi:hypothetical protein